MRRILFTASASAISLALVSLPFSVDLDAGDIVATSAWAKKGGNGGGQGNGNGGGSSGGSNSNGGGSSSGNTGSSGSNSNGNSGGSSASNSNAGGSAGSSNVDSSANSAPAVSKAQRQLGAAEAELAAARRALANTLVDGDAMKVAIARGRVAGAEYAVSAAEMDVTAAQAGIVDIEPASR